MCIEQTVEEYFEEIYVLQCLLVILKKWVGNQGKMSIIADNLGTLYEPEDY